MEANLTDNLRQSFARTFHELFIHLGMLAKIITII